MAAEDFGDKTHEATPYRRQKAREEGQVVKSQDLASAALLVAGLMILWYFGGLVAKFLGEMAREFLGGGAWFGFLYLPQKVALDWQRINPLTNWRRIVSWSNAIHLGFGLLKVALITLVAGWSLWGERDRLMNLAG